MEDYGRNKSEYGGKDLWKRRVLSLEWKAEGVIDSESKGDDCDEVIFAGWGDAINNDGYQASVHRACIKYSIKLQYDNWLLALVLSKPQLVAASCVVVADRMNVE